MLAMPRYLRWTLMLLATLVIWRFANLAPELNSNPDVGRLILNWIDRSLVLLVLAGLGTWLYFRQSQIALSVLVALTLIEIAVSGARIAEHAGPALPTDYLVDLALCCLTALAAIVALYRNNRAPSSRDAVEAMPRAFKIGGLVVLLSLPALLFAASTLSSYARVSAKGEVSENITMILRSQLGIPASAATELSFNRNFLGLDDRHRYRSKHLEVLQKDPKNLDRRDAIHLFFLLPDLAPVPEYYAFPDAAWQYAKDDLARKSGNLIEITLQQGTNVPESVTAPGVEAGRWKKRDDFNSIEGFELFHDLPFEVDHGRSVILVPKDLDYRDRLYFRCPSRSPSEDDAVYCTSDVSGIFPNKMFGTIRFPKARLQDWKKIHDAAAAWVSAHVANISPKL